MFDPFGVGVASLHAIPPVAPVVTQVWPLRGRWVNPCLWALHQDSVHKPVPGNYRCWENDSLGMYKVVINV
jgi:hypothetical protein